MHSSVVFVFAVNWNIYLARKCSYCHMIKKQVVKDKCYQSATLMRNDFRFIARYPVKSNDII